jgi:hypothetical protein
MVLPVVNLLPEVILDWIPDLEPDPIRIRTQDPFLDLESNFTINLIWDQTPEPIPNPIPDPICYF